MDDLAQSIAALPYASTRSLFNAHCDLVSSDFASPDEIKASLSAVHHFAVLNGPESVIARSFIPQWYDERAYMEAALSRGLEGFDELTKARHVAGYDRHEKLLKWIVEGTYFLDAAGNVLVLGSPQLDAPRLSRKTEGAGMCRFSEIAPGTSICARCGHGWTLRNAYQATFSRHRQPDPDAWLHSECAALEVHEHVRDKITPAVCDVFGQGIKLRAVPNRYGSQKWRGPWFICALPGLGSVRIGWRKRVIEIEWSEGPDGEKLFADEATTKCTHVVHAWGYDKLAEYLERMKSDVQGQAS